MQMRLDYHSNFALDSFPVISKYVLCQTIVAFKQINKCSADLVSQKCKAVDLISSTESRQNELLTFLFQHHFLRHHDEELR